MRLASLLTQSGSVTSGGPTVGGVTVLNLGARGESMLFMLWQSKNTATVRYHGTVQGGTGVENSSADCTYAHRWRVYVRTFTPKS